MQKPGYYEIINHRERTGLKMSVIAGNVQYNRLHWHDSLEIMCCVYGSFCMTIQGIAHVLHEGDLITVNCGAAHEITEGTPDGLQLIFLVDASLLRLPDREQYAFSTVGDLELSQEHKDIRTVRASIASLACLLLPDSANITEGSSYPEEQWYQLHMELYRILMCLSRHKQPVKIINSSMRPFKRFIRCVEIIHQDYDKPLSVKSLADEIGFSEPTIYRLFQTHMGISFNHYLNSVRISAACGLIENSTGSMTEIAGQCGFSSLSNFYRTFRQFVGMPPREYRKAKGINTGPAARWLQKDLLQLNRFKPLWELPYTREELQRLAQVDV